MSKAIGGAAVLVLACSMSLDAQWPKVKADGVPRDDKGAMILDAAPPKTADGHPDLSGTWVIAQTQPLPGQGRGRGGRGGRGGDGAAAPGAAPGAPAAQGGGRAAAPGGAADGADAAAGPPPGGRGRGGVSLEPTYPPFPADPKSPPLATFFEIGANLPDGLSMTPWAEEIKKARRATQSKDNPDANCLPMGFPQFHLQPQPRKIVQLPKQIIILYEANYGLRTIYMDGRKLPPQGEPQPFWYGYSVGRWEGDTLVVETNNLRGAEESPNDGWLDVNGSPYSNQAKFTERFRRPIYGKLEIDITVEDPKAYTKPFTVRVNHRASPDEEPIEFICNENQQFRRRIKID